MTDFEKEFQNMLSKSGSPESAKNDAPTLEFNQDVEALMKNDSVASEPVFKAPEEDEAAPAAPAAEAKPEPEPAAEQPKADEELADVVVPADAEPEEASVPAKKPAAPARRAPRPEQVVLDSADTGEISDELMRRKEADLDDAEKETITYRKLVTASKTGRILWGTVVGAERSENLNQIILSVLFNGVSVKIPDSEFFEPNYKFGGNYDDLTNETERRNVRERHARYYLGATVPFVLKGVSRHRNDAGITLIDAVGSRKAAMKQLRDIWFIKTRDGKPIPGARRYEVKEGDSVDAHVVKVRPDMVTVECLGVETRIQAPFVSAGIVENCESLFKVGDTMKVRIRKIYINDIVDKDGKPVDKDVYLNVTGRVYEAPAAIYSMSERSTYRGKVAAINREKKHCIVMLDNGVRAIVPDSNVEGNLHLTIGDTVEVRVLKIFDTSAFGRAVKLF